MAAGTSAAMTARKATSGSMWGSTCSRATPTCPLATSTPSPCGAAAPGTRWPSTLSAPTYSAQKLPAQYACVRPRPNGNMRAASCSAWPIMIQGPREAHVMSTTVTPMATNRVHPTAPLPAHQCLEICTKYTGPRYTNRCFMLKSTVKTTPDSQSQPRCMKYTDHMSRPMSTPLYWKWMWSTSNSPALHTSRKNRTRPRRLPCFMVMSLASM
mmetsp:Transcript_22155/g.56290  ORF Transcript_22155/g.56290 Transcript_22155/m.56290 type:complete len:212 (-) Transcript_22155:287-922(-)